MSDGPRRIMISAGELSGDMHAAAVIEAAKSRGLGLEFFGLGGDNMAAAGADLREHLRETAVMGLTEVLGSLGRVLKIRGRLCAMIADERPDAVVLIDSPDLNRALAKAAFKAGVPVVYYVCPQVWAWRPGRVRWLGRLVARRCVIFEFEEEFFRSRGLSADWVGHPLFDELPLGMTGAEARQNLGLDPDAPVLALFPGSRAKVLARLARPMLGAAALLVDALPGLRVVVARAPTVSPEKMDDYLRDVPRKLQSALTVAPARAHEVLLSATAALLASGTSTAEGAILGTPMVVTYRVSALSWFLARRLVKVPFVSVANLAAGREVVPELLQDAGTPENMAAALRLLLADGPARRGMVSGLREARAKLGSPGAAGRVLDVILQAAGSPRARAN
ncbi:MAG: lipid-A-disaccharide synthase [Deltaproteobacteria bacterium]|jgi:lipid-A-disaccharide synthase|nr:lipid-A-disaccharide synthase [Deltaproteobacteria bacterium]